MLVKGSIRRIHRSSMFVIHRSLRKTSTGKIYVNPQKSLVTEHVNITGEGFEPNTKITVHASLHCEAENLLFMSHAHFMTSNNGCLDLSSMESKGGTYYGIDGMGLFWSMLKSEDCYSRVQMSNASVPLNYDFHVLNGHVDEINSTLNCVDTCSIERSFLRSSVDRQPIKTGNIRGTLFIPEGNGPFPGIITLYGGNRRRQVIEDSAALFSNNGFATLALAYFGVDDLPKSYAEQPVQIEYFEEALKFLDSHEKVQSNSIGIWGSSKGGDIALGMMSYLPQVQAVAAINACVSSIGTSTTYGDKTVDTLGFNLERLSFFPDGTLNILNVLNNPKDEPKSIHPFELSDASLLSIAGLDDYNWNSALFADIIQEKMHAAGKSDYEILKFHGLGHCIDAPYMPVCVNLSHPLFPAGMMVYFGGKDRETHSSHVSQIWGKTILFFKQKLMKGSYSY